MFLNKEQQDRERRRVINLFTKQNRQPSKYCKMTHSTCTPGLVYVAKGEDGRVKIGCAKDESTLKQRLSAMQKQYKQEFTLLFTLFSVCKQGLEKRIHENLKRFHINHYAGDELFEIDDTLIESIGNIEHYRQMPVTKTIYH